MTYHKIIRRGDILLVDFSEARTRNGESAFLRPGIVITNNTANEYSPAIVVVPCTSQNTENVKSHELLLEIHRSGLNFESKAQIQLIRHINRERIIKYLSHTPRDLIDELDKIIAFHLGINQQ